MIEQVFAGTFVQVSRAGHGLEIYHDYVLTTDEAGLIVDFTPKTSTSGQNILANSENKNIQRVEALSGSFFLPTFSDLHLHAPQFLYLGTGLHLPLMQWLDEYAYKAEERLDANPDLARTVYSRLARRLIEGGTGAALLFGTIEERTNIILAEEFQSAGIRGFVGKLSMDISSRPSYIEASASASLEAAANFINRCNSLTENFPVHSRLVEPVITPRFVPTCSNELLKGLGQLAKKQNVRVQSHMAEARDMVDWVQADRGIDDFQIFKQSNLLTAKTIQAHCTYLPDILSSTLEELRDLGTAIAHCPLSNAYFSNLPFPLREALDAGVKVGLGTDVAGGYSLDIMNAMRQAVIVSRTRDGSRIEQSLSEPATSTDKSLMVHWTDALFLATRGGALALGLGTGVFVPGASFDAQRIDLVDKSGRGIANLDFFDPVAVLTEDHIEKWWCLGDNGNRSAVWVQGKQIL